MFRSAKKRPRNIINRRVSQLRREGEDDEEDKETNAESSSAATIAGLKHRSKEIKRRTGGVVVRSRIVPESGAPESHPVKRSKTALGHGARDAETTSVSETTGRSMHRLRTGAPSYGRDALDQLKAAQQKPPPTVPGQDSCVDVTQAEPAASTTESITIPRERDQFPSESPTRGVPVADSTVHPALGQKPDASKGKPQGFPGVNQHERTKSFKKPIHPLRDLKQQLESVVSQLEARDDDLGHAIMKRVADSSQVTSSLKQRNEAVQIAGEACTSYQQLRHDLAVRVGALRDLEAKIVPIQKELTQIVVTQCEQAQREWTQVQDDHCSTLGEAELLDQVLGRQPALHHLNGSVDEFGRDIQSQFRRERELRYGHRRKQRDAATRLEPHTTADMFFDTVWSSLQDTETRYEMLQRALQVAVDDIDKEFTSTEALLRMFLEWKEQRSDDFAQCHAAISLNDLALVLGRLEFCRSDLVCTLTVGDRKELKIEGLVSEMTRLATTSDAILGEMARNCLKHTFQAQTLPFLLELLKDAPSFCVASTRMTSLVCECVKNISERVEIESPLRIDLYKAVSESIPKAIETLSILLASGGHTCQRKEDERLCEAKLYAEVEQPKWLQQLVRNLLDAWVPLLRGTDQYEPALASVMDFISCHYLLLLSSLESNVATALFAPICATLTQAYSDVMQSPNYILQSAPILAASAAYGLQRNRSSTKTHAADDKTNSST